MGPLIFFGGLQTDYIVQPVACAAVGILRRGKSNRLSPRAGNARTHIEELQTTLQTESVQRLLQHPSTRHRLEPRNALLHRRMRTEQIHQPAAQQRTDDKHVRGGRRCLHRNLLHT